MKVDLSKELVGFDGKPLVNKIDGVECVLPDGNQVYLKFGLKVKDASGKEVELIDDRKPKTVGELLLQCVTTPLQKDNDDTAEKRLRLFELSQEIYKNKKKFVVLEAEDIVELKERARILFLEPQTFAGIVNAMTSKRD